MAKLIDSKGQGAIFMTESENPCFSLNLTNLTLIIISMLNTVVHRSVVYPNSISITLNVGFTVKNSKVASAIRKKSVQSNP